MKTLRNLTLTLLISLVFFTLDAQQWQWTGGISCTAASRTNGLKRDSDGNLLMYIVFQGTITVKGRSIASRGNKDVLLVKYTPNGDTLWVRHGGSTGLDEPRDLIIDNNNNIYITGGFSANCIFDTKTALIAAPASEDIYLTKYSSAGVVQWAKNIAWGPGQTRSSGLIVDDGGNLEMVGFYNTSIYFSGDTLTSSGSTVANFFAKYDGNGNFIRAINYPSNDIATRLNTISKSNDNALLITGFYNGTLTTQTKALTSKGSGDLILMKVDTAGAEIWVRTAGGKLDDRGQGASSDGFGDIFMTGYISDSAFFDIDSLGQRDSEPLVVPGLTNNDMFLAKYNKNGTLQWKTRNGSTSNDQGQGVSVSGNIVQFTGYFSGTLIFGNDTLKSSALGNNDAGFFIYNTEGDAIKGVSVQGSGDDQGFEVNYDNAGSSYLAGYFDSNILYLLDKQITNSTPGTRKPFIAKYQIPFASSFTQITQVACNGGNSGALTVTPFYGQYPFTYQWSHDAGLNDSVATGLAAGNYTVTITDARDSAVVSSIVFGMPPAIDITLIPTDLNCFQSADGAIATTVTGGTIGTGYNYSWTGTTGYNPISEDQSGLSAGWFYVTVSDANLCEGIDSVLISQPGKIQFGTTVVTSASAGSSNGKIDVNLTGGTASFGYAWAKEGISLPGQTSSSLINISGANYQVTVTDANTCTGDTNFLVPDPSLLQFNKYITDVSCNGSTDGSAYVSILTVDPVADSVTYIWTNGSVDSSISNVMAGTYGVTVTEWNNGSTLAVKTDNAILISQPSALTINSLAATTIDCYGDSTGAITLSVSGGSPDYSYNWSSGQTVESLSQIAAGSYQVTITDANLCEAFGSIDVTQFDSIHVDFAALQVLLCFGDADAIVQATASGGAGGYSYLWNDQGNQTSATATSLSAALYTLLVTDNNFCVKNAYYELLQPEAIVVAITDTQNVSCFDGSDGSISVSVIGGQEPYTYAWNPSVGTTNTISNLGAITYSLTVTDNTSICANDSFSYTVKKPSTALTLSDVPANHVNNSCFGGSTGSFELFAQGGWGTYEYSVEPGVWQSDSVFDLLPVAVYTAFVRDAGGCAKNDVFVQITQPTQIEVTAFVFGSTINALATGGTPPRYFSLDGGTPQTNGQFVNVSSGTHLVSVTDANDCGPVVSEALNVINSVENFVAGNLNIYPNPSSGHFTFSFDALNESELHIQVYNHTGALVNESEIPSATKFDLDLSAFGSGIYIVKLNGTAINQRLIVE